MSIARWTASSMTALVVLFATAVPAHAVATNALSWGGNFARKKATTKRTSR